MKRQLGIVLIILGSAITLWPFLMTTRMLLNFGHIAMSLHLGDVSLLPAFIICIFVTGGGVALILVGRKLRRTTS